MFQELVIEENVNRVKRIDQKSVLSLLMMLVVVVIF